ncbi:hypothetical protein R6Q59_006029 [Mikania micrantha]
MILKEVSAAGNRDCAGGSLQLDQGGNVVCRPQRSLTRGVTAGTRLRMRVEYSYAMLIFVWLLSLKVCKALTINNIKGCLILKKCNKLIS